MTELTATTSLPGEQTEALGADRPAVLGKVLGLLSFAFVFTAAGALIGATTSDVLPLALLGGVVTLFSLIGLRKIAPINIGLLYAFSMFQGMSLAPVLNRYITQDLNGAIAQAALGTAAVALIAGGYGVVTKRDLSGIGTILLLGLIAFLIASIGGLFLQSPLLSVILGGVGAILFTGFIVYDLNAAANCRTDEDGESIMLAVNVYLDLLNLFVLLLRLIADSDD